LVGIFLAISVSKRRAKGPAGLAAGLALLAAAVFLLVGLS